MAETPIEHRHYSRLIGPLAREVTIHWRAVLFLSIILCFGGLGVVSDPVFRSYLGGSVTLFFTVFFGMALLLTVMLRSFRKALLVILPAIAGVPVVLLCSFVLGHNLSPMEGLFATIILSTACGVNYDLVKKYFDERRKPATPMTSVFESFSKLSRPVAGVYILEAFTFIGIAAFTNDVTGYLGIFVAAANVLGLIASVTVLPASILLYEHAMAARVLSENEEKVFGYVKSFGSQKTHSPIVASWLGVAVSDVEKSLESLTAKGYLGSHFFAIDDPLVWFLLLGSYLLGTIFARTGLPAFAMVWYDLGLAFLMTVAVCLLSPQSLQGLSRGTRRFLGILLVLITLAIAFRTSVLLTEILMALLILGLISLFFGSSAAWLVGNTAVAIYFALIFLLGWLQFDWLATAPKIWAVGIGAVIFLLQLVIEEEAYVNINRE
jgi:hypothetical protein